MVDTTNIGPLADFYLSEGQRLAHMGSWAFDAAGFKHWSPELFAIHGLDPAAKAPSIPEYIALVHPEDREFVAQEIQKMVADHHGFDFTKRIVRPDGTIRHVRCVGVPTAHGEGEGEGFVGTGIDVTEQEQLTAALRKSELELRQILDLAPQIIGVLGPGANGYMRTALRSPITVSPSRNGSREALGRKCIRTTSIASRRWSIVLWRTPPLTS